MKHINHLYKLGVLLLAATLPLTAFADEDEDPVHYTKEVTQEPDENNYYYIDIEAFTTGTTVQTQSAVPCDIALVLDYSTSMSNNSSYVYTYTPQESKTYSYNSYGNTNLYYKYGDNYYQVSRGFVNDWGNKYYLYFTVNRTRHYLLADGGQSTYRPSYTSNSATLYTGVLYESSRQRKIDILKNAVNSFIEEVVNQANLDGIKGNDDDVDHRISISIYNNSVTASQDFLSVLNSNSITTLKNLVSNTATANYTRQDLGMAKAKEYFDGLSPTRNSNKVVVLFTDGEPYPGNGSGITKDGIANAAINTSHTLKAAPYNATVYSIGVFTDNIDYGSMDAFMHNVSSEYPNATNISDGWKSDDMIETTYFQESDGSDLSDIFTKIATESSTPTFDLNETTPVVLDVMSPYFRLPGGTTASNLTVWALPYTSTKNEDEVKNYKFAERADAYKLNIKTQDEYDGLTDTEKEKAIILTTAEDKEVEIKGFDFGTYFCGLHETSDGDLEIGGKKLSFRIRIERDPDNPGGTDLPTNSSNSGIYINGENMYPFPIPSFIWPNIIIQANGLQNAGESASYTVYRIKTEILKNTDGSSILDANGNYTFNYDDTVLDPDFDPIHVVVTKQTDEDNEIVKAKIKLNEEGRYLIVEDTWTQGYTVKPADISSYSGSDDDIRTAHETAGEKISTTVINVGNRSVIRTINSGTKSIVNAQLTPKDEGTLFIFNHSSANRNEFRYDEAVKNNVFTSSSVSAN